MIRFLLMKRTLGWMVVPIILFTLSSCQEQEEPQEAFQLLEATLPQIEGALASGTITSQDLVEMYLARIAEDQDNYEQAMRLYREEFSLKRLVDRNTVRMALGRVSC